MLEDRYLLSTYTVNALTDTGTGSGLTGDLRYCITNATSGSDTIDFAPGLTGTIKLESALPALNGSVVIEGPGASQITVARDPAGNYPYIGIFTVGSAASVEISGLTLSDSYFSAISNAGTLTVRASTFSDNNGNNNGGGAITNSGTATVSDSTFSGNSGATAGAIDNTGTLTINDSILSGNYSDGGGAIGNTGTMTINNCTLSGNTDFESGGGALYNNNGTLTINNSTLSGNQAYPYYTNDWGATDEGGAIYMGGGSLAISSSTLSGNSVWGGPSTAGTTPSGFSYSIPAGNGFGGGLYVAMGTVTIDHSTVADNEAIGGAGIIPDAGFGGGIFNAAGISSLQMFDTILADDTADVGPDLYGSLTSEGHNLVGNTADGFGFAPSDLVNVNPDLDQLRNNGGPTETMALLPGSPAIDAGDNTNAPAYDQRGPGFARIVNGTIDIGAFEVQSSGTPASSLAVTGFPSVITAGNAGSFTVTALNADGTTDTGYTGTVYFTSTDPHALLPAYYTFTTADAGAQTFNATLTTAGSQSIKATDTTTGSATGSDTSITVTPAAATQLVFGQQPSTTTAGQTISSAATVAVEDQYGNLVTSDSSTVTLTLSSGAFAGDSATARVSGGVATFAALTIDTAGSYTLKATDGSLTPTNSGTFTIQPAAASTLSVTNFPTSTTAGVAHNFSVTLRDPYGNIATGYTGTVHFSSSDPKASLPANYTFTVADKGVHNFSATLKTAGTQSITATDTTTASLTGMEGGIKVNSAAASKFVLKAPASVSIGVPFSLTVTVEDSYGNAVVGYSGTIHFSSRDNRATLPANYTFTATDQGVHTFTALVLYKKGNQTITVTDTHNSALTGNAVVDVL